MLFVVSVMVMGCSLHQFFKHEKSKLLIHLKWNLEINNENENDIHLDDDQENKRDVELKMIEDDDESENQLRIVEEEEGSKEKKQQEEEEDERDSISHLSYYLSFYWTKFASPLLFSLIGIALVLRSSFFSILGQSVVIIGIGLIFRSLAVLSVSFFIFLVLKDHYYIFIFIYIGHIQSENQEE